MNDEVVEAYSSIKMGHKYKYVIYKLNESLTEIVLQEKAEQGEYSEFIGKLPQVSAPGSLEEARSLGIT